MTPAQRKALIAYRDRGTNINIMIRRILIRDGHLAPDHVTILTMRPEDLPPYRTQGDKVVELTMQGKTVAEIATALGMSRKKVYSARNRNEITGIPTNKPFNLKNAMVKTQINQGSFRDFLAANPDIEPILRLAARERITMLEAAGRLLRRDEEPHPVFRRSIRL